MEMRMFKASRQTSKFIKGQSVWVIKETTNFAFIKFKWQGSGSYATATIDKSSSIIDSSGIIDVDLDLKFYNSIYN